LQEILTSTPIEQNTINEKITRLNVFKVSLTILEIFLKNTQEQSRSPMALDYVRAFLVESIF